jgi:hypothetical protein
MKILDSILGQKDKKSTENKTKISTPVIQTAQSVIPGDNIPLSTGKMKFTVACRRVPFQLSMAVSPDESLICCVTPDNNVTAYESGTDKPKWKLAVKSSIDSTCAFVGPERLLVVSSKYNKEDQSLIQLVNTADGRSITEKIGPFNYTGWYDTDPHTGLYVYGLFTLEAIQTAGDKIEITTWQSGQLGEPGPRIGPDGKIYFIAYWNLQRTDGDKVTPIMPGNNCIHFEGQSKVYCGGGFHDRSEGGSLNIFDIMSGKKKSIQWGYDPVSQIMPAGRGRLLISSSCGGTLRAIFTAKITLFSIAKEIKEWSIIIDDLPWGSYIHYPLLISAPEEGWALIKTGKSLKVISLEDGNTIGLLKRKFQFLLWAKWLASRELLYLASIPHEGEPGFMECYRI